MDPFVSIQKRDGSTGSKLAWKPFLRQIIVSSGVWMSAFMFGLSSGAPTVFIPQIRKENNSTIAINDEMASWLASAVSFSSLPWIMVLLILAKIVGRKICSVIAFVDIFISFTIFYYSSSVIQVLIGEFTQGFFIAAMVVIYPMIITEYTSSKYRGVFLTIKAATYFWGIWVSNAIGTFFHWKKIGLLGIICALYSMVTVLIWPESPYWLATKGKYTECEASHRWLKGCDEESEKELKSLIISEKEYRKSREQTKLSVKDKVKELYMTLKSKKFFKPTFISFMIIMLYLFSGKLVIMIYALDILKKVTESESTSYVVMLILDGLTVFCMYIGCILSRYLKRRPLLLVPSFIGVVCLFALSLHLYLMHISVIEKNNYVSIALLMSFSIVISCGPLLLAVPVALELIPIRSRNLAMFVITLSTKLISAILLKTFPNLLKGFGLHGAFLLFGVISSFAIVLVYIFLPETKDKTLLEISDSIIGTNKNSTEMGEIDILLKPERK